MPATNKAARNERRKITATAVNNVGVAIIVTGIVVPSVSIAYQMTLPQTKYWSIFALLWLIRGLGLHAIARDLLGRIEE